MAGHTESESYDSDGDKTLQPSPVPAYMSSIVRREYLYDVMCSLPPKVKNRVLAVKNIQHEQVKLEAEFYKQIYELEKQYHQKYVPLYEKRKLIITGEVEPTEEKPTYKENTYAADPNAKEGVSHIMREIRKTKGDPIGIPCFWLTIFRNTEVLSDMVQLHDEPLLKKLYDITLSYDEPQSYTLHFHFNKNKYFSNAVLSKQYFLKAEVDADYPFGFEGPEIYKCKGCNIDWEKGFNLTIKTIRKKQKHKERGEVRTITKQVPNDSFFNFFSPPDQSKDKDEYDDEAQAVLSSDFEIGHFLRSRVIPKAVLYFTGDIIDDEEEDEDESDIYDDEDDNEKEESGGEECDGDDVDNGEAE